MSGAEGVKTGSSSHRRRSSSCGGSSSSSSSDRYHLASADITPESVVHAYYVDGPVNQQGVSESADSFTSAGANSPSVSVGHVPHLLDDRTRFSEQQEGHGRIAARTVTATIVDPSALDAERGADFAGSRPIPIADNPARMSVRNVGASSYDSGYNSRQQPQPTLAALALADRCGQLAPELGYYPPHRVLTDFGQSPGFYSEPASGAGSPNSFMSDGRVFVGRGAVSADNTLAMSYGSSRAPSSTSALGVMFSAPAAAMDPMAHARGMRYTESTIATAARSPAMSDVVRGSDMHTHHHFQQHRSAFSSASSPQAPDAGKGFYSGDESSQPGASRSQLSVLPENSSLKSFHGEFGGENNRRLAQSSTEFAPHASSSPSISAVAASLTAASSSFSFRNSQTQFASSHILPMQQPSYSSSNRHSTATSTTASRDSMFLRLKEKMKYFKPRSRPHSDNFADRRSAAGVPHGSAGSQPLPSSILGSPPLNKANRGNSTSSETQLFGMSLGCAVKVAGVHVGIVADSGESCVVPTVVAVCGRHLCDQGQQMQGIFRVNGSMKRVQKLQDEFCEQPHYGRHIEWAGYTLHDAATILRRYLISLPESVISAAHYNAFLEKLTESVPDSEKARDYALLICQLTPESRHTLLYMLELLSVFARQDNCTRTLMNASNLAAVLQPCLLVHPGQIANPHEYGKAKEVVEFLIAHASELHTSSVSSEHRQDSYSLQQQQPPPVDGQMVGTDGFVIVGQDGLSRQGGFGAGLIVAGPRDDGSTNHGNIETSGPNALAPKVRQAQPYEHWQSAITRDSGLTTVNSADSVGSAQLAARQHDGTRGDLAGSYGGQPPMATSQDSVTIRDTTPQPSLPLQQGLQTRLAVASDSDISRVPPAPRGDSVMAMNMTLSTPVLNAANIGLAQTVRPLGSVTARFFDPTAVPESGGGNDDERHLDLANFQQQLRLAESPGETGSSFSQDMPSAGSPFMGSFTSWPSNRSSMALSSVQYQYTRSPMTPPLQYQRQQQDQQRLYGSNAQINERPGLNSGDSPRPRRSQSFAVPVSSNEGMGATSPHARLEAKRSAEKLSSGAISNPGVVVQARRGTTGDRRAGSIALSAGQGIVPALPTPAAAAADSPQPRAARPLPTIPLANTTRAATEITQSLHNPDRLPHGSALPASKTVGATPRGSQPLLSSVGGGGGAFSLYPLPQAGRARGASSSSSGGGNLKQAAPAGTARIATRSPAMQYGSSGPGHVPAQRHVLAETAYSRLSRHGGPNSGNAGRASWLSEDVPEDELVRGFDSVTGVSKDPATGVNNIRAATASDRAHPSVPYLMNRYSEAQQHKLHPIERPEQMPISSQAPAPEQGKHAKLQRSAAGGDAARDKVSMARLKNIFRIKNGGNSSGGGDELERPMPRELVHSSASAATSTGARQYHYQESSHSPSLTSRSEAGSQAATESLMRAPRCAVASTATTSSAAARGGGSISSNGYGSQYGGSSTPAAAQHSSNVSSHGVGGGGSFEAANRIQVAVPAGHLSIVYPDSPMSKTDTLRRTSTVSLGKRASQSQSQSQSQNAGGVAASSSGHAYLVDPDQEEATEDVGGMSALHGQGDAGRYMGGRATESNAAAAFDGTQLHPAASNSTTLHSSSYALQQQHQQQRQTSSGSFNGTSPGSHPSYRSPMTQQPWSAHYQPQPQPQQQQQQQLKQPFQPYHMRVHAPSALGAAIQAAPGFAAASGDGRRLYGAAHRLAGSDRRGDGGGEGSSDSAFVLPSISNGSPLLSGLSGFEFGERSPISQHQQYQTLQGQSSGQRHSHRRSVVHEGDTVDDAAADAAGGSAASNSPRRSRSLRNTITSLRRKLSRSSRNGSGNNAHNSSSPDMTPLGMDEAAAAH